MNRIPRNDLELSQKRLNLILNRRRLTFNPYEVSDTRLLELVQSVGWGKIYDLTQMVVLEFTRLHETSGNRPFDGIFMRVGPSPEEVLVSSNRLKYKVTPFDTLCAESSKVGKYPILHDKDIAKLVGKRMFVSHTIPGRLPYGKYGVVYRMHRLKGKTEEDTTLIRRAMIDAKLEMLNRVLNYPECEHYLDCRPDLFDFKTQINRAIQIISNYSNVIPPQAP